MLSKYISFPIYILWGHVTLQEVHLKPWKSSQSLFLKATVCKLELCFIHMSILHVLFLISILLWFWCLVLPDTASLYVCGFILSISLNRILKSLGAGSQSLCALTFQEGVLMFTGLSPASSCIISSGTHVSYASINAFFWPSRRRYPLVKEVLSAREFSAGSHLYRTQDLSRSTCVPFNRISSKLHLTKSVNCLFLDSKNVLGEGYRPI